MTVENLSPGLSIFLGENEAGKSTCLEFLRTMAGAHDAEDFLRQAALHEELQSLTLRRQDLEDALRLAAAKTPLPEFLAAFEQQDQEAQERRSAAISEELTAMWARPVNDNFSGDYVDGNGSSSTEKANYLDNMDWDCIFL